MAFWDDGKGNNGPASVSAARRGNVSAKTAPRRYYVSRDDQQTFDAIQPSFSAAAGNYVQYIKNTSTTKNMYIDSAYAASLNAAVFKVWEVTGTAAAGTTITPANSQLSSGLLAEATSMGGGSTITGLTTVKQVGTIRVPAADEKRRDYGGALIIGPNKAIAIEYDTGTTGLCETAIEFHYETIGAT